MRIDVEIKMQKDKPLAVDMNIRDLCPSRQQIQVLPHPHSIREVANSTSLRCGKWFSASRGIIG